MILKDLVFENEHRKEQMEGKLPIFNKEYHLAQLYLYYLGEGFVLDGCGKLTIYVKPRKNLPKYLYWNFEGTSRYYLEAHQIETYSKANSEEEADLLLCDYTHDILIDIATTSDCSEDVINRIHYARDAIIKSNFSLSYEVTKYSKTNRSRTYRALVFRNINRVIGEVWSIKIIDKKNDDCIVYERYLSKQPSYFNGFYRYQKTFWDGNTFILMDKSGIVWNRINV